MRDSPRLDHTTTTMDKQSGRHGPHIVDQPLTSSLATKTKFAARKTSSNDIKQAPVAAQYNWDAASSLENYSYLDANKLRKVTYYNSLSESDHAARRFTDCLVIGLDVEWKPERKPERKKNESNRIALVQVAGRDECQLHHIHSFHSFPPNLREVLENPNILKVGAGIDKDVKKLKLDWRVRVQSSRDLRCLAWEVDSSFWSKGRYQQKDPIALARLVARYLKRSVDKEQQCSNWEEGLTRAQLDYAVNDACAVLDVYNTLEKIRKRPQSLKDLYSPPIISSYISSSISPTSLPRHTAQTDPQKILFAAAATRGSLWNAVRKRMEEFTMDADGVEVLTGFNGNVRTPRETSLHLAAKAGNRDMFKWFIANGSQLEARDAYSRTAFHLALQYGHLPLVVYILATFHTGSQSSHPYFSPPPGVSLLHLAIEPNNLEIVRTVIRHFPPSESDVTKQLKRLEDPDFANGVPRSQLYGGPKGRAGVNNPIERRKIHKLLQEYVSPAVLSSSVPNPHTKHE